MGLFIRQNDNRSQFQEKLAADLRERAKQQAGIEAEPLDQSKKSNYIKDTEQASKGLWLWLVGIGAAVAGLVVFMITR